MKTFVKFLMRPFAGKKYLQGFFGALFLVSLKGMNIGNGAGWEGSGEKWVLGFVAKNMPSQKELIMFDVGANIGAYAQAASSVFSKFKRSHKIYSFEPSRKTFELLANNTKGVPEILVNNVALGDKSVEAELFSDAEASGLASLLQRDLSASGVTLSARERVKVDNLDNFCAEHQISRIDFLKLDVEGYELRVLSGAERMLKAKNINCVQFEFGGTDIDARVFYRDFYNLLHENYNMYRILQDGLQPMGRYNEQQEIFLTANYLAILKD